MFVHVNHNIVLPELEVTTTETGRTYVTPDGNVYPSITTILGATDESKKEGLQKWRDKIGHREADRITRVAGRRGQTIHDMAEAYLKNDPGWNKGVMPINAYTFVCIKESLDTHVDNIWFQEIPLYSDKLRIAGRVDLIAEWCGELAVIDFKTARNERREEWIHSYKQQMAFYTAALYERTGIVIKKNVVLMTSDHHGLQTFTSSPYDHLESLIAVRNAYTAK